MIATLWHSQFGGVIHFSIIANNYIAIIIYKHNCVNKLSDQQDYLQLSAVTKWACANKDKIYIVINALFVYLFANFWKKKTFYAHLQSTRILYECIPSFFTQ